MDALSWKIRELLADPASRMTLVGLLVAALLVNWPLANGLLTDRRIASEGELLRVPVIETRNYGTDSDPDYRITYQLPQGMDQRRWEASLGKAAWERARLSSSIRVRVLREDPGNHHVEGADVGHPWRWVALALDLTILGLGYYLLVVRRKRYAPPPVERKVWR